MLSIALRAATFLSVLATCLALGTVRTVSADDLDDDQTPNTSTDLEDKICKKSPTTFTVNVDGVERTIPYAVINGRAIVEGDIDIGSAEEFPKGAANYAPPVIPEFLHGRPTRWPNNTVPYVINPALGAKQRALIAAAIAEWQNHTAVRFEEMAWSTRDWRRYNYVKFTDLGDGRCKTNRIGIAPKSKKPESTEDENINWVNLSGCGITGNVVHEIGHVLGLYHEQSRYDRDRYVTVIWANIEDSPGENSNEFRSQYCKALYKGGSELPGTTYDYLSIMHYPVAGSFAKDCPALEGGKCPILRPNPERLKEQKVSLKKVGQRDGLSQGDIDVINSLYPPKTPPEPDTQTSCTTTATRRCPAGARPPPPVIKPPPRDRPHRRCYPETYCHPRQRPCCNRGIDWCGPRIPAPRLPRHFFPDRFSHGRWWVRDLWDGRDFDDWDD